MKAWKRYTIAAALALSTLSSLSAPAQAQEKVRKGDVVAVCGDSITEQKQYSAFIEAYLIACQGDGPIRTAQFGWGGDTVGGFNGRGGPSIVMTLGATVVTTCFGMNDGGYGPLNEGRLKAYTDGLTKIVQDLKKGGVRLVIVGSPGVVDSETWKGDDTVYNATLGSFGQAAQKVAQEQGCVFANLHDLMMDVMKKSKAKYGEKYAFAGNDGVHPGANGHLVMAYAFLKAMGCDGNIGTITLDLATSKATASEGHKILSANAGTVEVESSRYPFCFWGKPEDPNATTGIIQFFPFNEDLNRFNLVVSGAPADATVRVTWGEMYQDFKGAEVAKGINLAAEFLDNNPFSSAFQKLRGDIAAKQAWETTYYKNYLMTINGLQKELRESDAELATALDRAVPLLAKKDAALAAGVAAKVAPVKHTIKVEIVK